MNIKNTKLIVFLIVKILFELKKIILIMILIIFYIKKSILK